MKLCSTDRELHLVNEIAWRHSCVSTSLTSRKVTFQKTTPAPRDGDVINGRPFAENSIFLRCFFFLFRRCFLFFKVFLLSANRGELVTSFTCQSRSRLRIKIHLWSLQTNSDGGVFISQSLLLVLNIFIKIFKGAYFAPSLLNLWLLQKNICRWSIIKFLTVFEYLKFFKYGYLCPSLFP